MDSTTSHPARITPVAVLVTAALALAACSPKAPEPVDSKFDADGRVRWYQQCWTHYNDRKWDEYGACYAPSAISQQYGYGKPQVRGSEEIVAAAKELPTMAPDVRGVPQLVLINFDRHHLASLSVVHGTNTGPVRDGSGKEGKPTGRNFGLWFAHSVEVDVNRQQVTQEFGVADSRTLAAQLGLSNLPARSPLAATAAAPQVVIASHSETETQNLATERSAIEAWNRHDAAAVSALSTDDYVSHDAARVKDMSRPEKEADLKAFWAAFGDARLATASVWPAGDYVVVEGRFEGTNNAAMEALNLKGTGRKAEVSFIAIDRFANGKIAESWMVYDSGEFTSQLSAAAAR